MPKVNLDKVLILEDNLLIVIVFRIFLASTKVKLGFMLALTSLTETWVDLSGANNYKIKFEGSSLESLKIILFTSNLNT